FLGRIDEQVKIRGLRIEPGEIESCLLRHPHIKEAVVIVWSDHKGEKYLCAYIVILADRLLHVPDRGMNKTGADDLRDFLSRTLPDYMIPSFFVHIESIPLTPNGKTDRKALPMPGTLPGEAGSAPRNQTEEKLAEIWADILNIEKTHIRIDESFFQVGGHSLRATILVSHIQKEFRVTVPLAEVFRYQTIRQLAGYIKTNSVQSIDYT
ncbi:MAG: hypothetical protein GY940_36695, partial [bacterium]|nr:hypothetical protein [bacterium]